jgi:hypothetical protein
VKPRRGGFTGGPTWKAAIGSVGWIKRPLPLLALLAVVLAGVLPSSRAERGDPASDADQSGGANSADRMVVWVGCGEVVALTDAQLDEWRARGVGGFACSAQFLFGLGGSQDWTAAGGKDLDEQRFSLERSIIDSRIVERAKHRGMRLYLTFYFANTYNASTPLANWFDDSGWQVVIERVRALAAAARSLGFFGIGFDQELYAQQGNVSTATWSWDYPGNTHSEAVVRLAAQRRGAELMAAIVSSFPDSEILAYASLFPETWDALVQKRINGVANAYADSVQLDFWDGLTSVRGYGPIHFLDAIFYKTTHLAGDDWDSALQYADNSLFAVLSRRLSNWDYASSRIFESPFAWIASGSTSFEQARSPDYVARQLAAFRKWGMGRLFAIYANDGLKSFDYTQYEAGMRAGAVPGVVDDRAPELAITEPDAQASSLATAADAIAVRGWASDNLAIRAVRWTNDRGGSGSAMMTWPIVAGSTDTGSAWRMEWVTTVPLLPGTNVINITAEDIKGITSTARIEVGR